MKYNRDDPNRWFYALFYTKSDFRNHQKNTYVWAFYFLFLYKKQLLLAIFPDKENNS